MYNHVIARPNGPWRSPGRMCEFVMQYQEVAALAFGLLAIFTGKPTTMNEKMTGAGAPKTLLPGRSCRQSALRNRLVTEEEFGRQCADIEHCQTSTCAVSCDRPASKPEDSADFQIPARIPLPTRYFLAYARAGHLLPGRRVWREPVHMMNHHSGFFTAPLLLQNGKYHL